MALQVVDRWCVICARNPDLSSYSIELRSYYFPIVSGGISNGQSTAIFSERLTFNSELNLINCPTTPTILQVYVLSTNHSLCDCLTLLLLIHQSLLENQLFSTSINIELMTVIFGIINFIEELFTSVGYSLIRRDA